MILSREDICTTFGCDTPGCGRTVQMWRGYTGTVEERWGGARVEGWHGAKNGEGPHYCPKHAAAAEEAAS